jgi:glycosyltransferase involved in cell wall biosynthesis
MLTGARSLIVNARAVASDIARFHPDHQARIFSLPFSAAPQAKWLSTRPRLARREVSVNGYFIVCNQFWKHKDHATLFDAFSLIAAEFPMINLVCTGATADYRDHDHFPSLVKKLTDQGLQTRVHILGMIPKIEQVDFLRDAIALIQPTLFEGGPGGGAVFDAISLGVPCLVSDIDVNRELDEPLVTFFSAQNASSLADKMRQALLGGHATRDTDMLLIERGNRRRQQCGVVLLEALRAAQ